MPRTVTIEDATLESLASNPEAVARLPFLLGAIAAAASAPAPRGQCPKCRNNAVRDARRAALGRARQAIAALSGPDRDALKAMLGADAILVYITLPDGRVSPLTI
jgi:hypothetical protein